MPSPAEDLTSNPAHPSVSHAARAAFVERLYQLASRIVEP